MATAISFANGRRTEETMNRVVITGAQVFDGTGADIRPADIAIEDGRIAEVGVGLVGDERVDATGTTVLPGLFDCHVHVMIHSIDVWRLAQQPLSYRHIEAAGHLNATLAGGITSVRDGSGADLGIKQAVDDGLIPGPRMHITVWLISQTGGHSDFTMPSGLRFGLLPESPGIPRAIVDGPQEMRRVVREMLRAGADVIKVAASGGVLSPRDNPRHVAFRDDELKVLVEEADAGGVHVMAHALGAPAIKAAVRAGVRSIEHGVYLDEEGIDLMLEHGTFLVPTLGAPLAVLESARSGAAIHEASLRKQLDASQHHQRSIGRAIKAGVKVAMGTDAGVSRHGENIREVEFMVDAGMTPQQAWLASTRNAAELLDVLDELGTIEPGKRADLVLLKGDALDVAGLTERVAAVYKDGKRVAG
jgi:imidazolonepropionase-like amidohydrolase